MKFSIDYLEIAHKASFGNRNEIMQSQECGCFYCKQTFPATLVEDWIEEYAPNAETARCPKCSIDSVLGSKSGYHVTDMDFLAEMNKRFF